MCITPLCFRSSFVVHFCIVRMCVFLKYLAGEVGNEGFVWITEEVDDTDQSWRSATDCSQVHAAAVLSARMDTGQVPTDCSRHSSFPVYY